MHHRAPHVKLLSRVANKGIHERQTTLSSLYFAIADVETSLMSLCKDALTLLYFFIIARNSRNNLV